MSPLGFLLIVFAGWTNRENRRAILYLIAENAVLREQLAKHQKTIRFSDRQRIRLARAGKRLGRKGLSSLSTIVSPDTLLRWHKNLVAKKWTFSDSTATKKVGRPPLSATTRRLVIRLAEENPNWGYRRIVGEMKKSGIVLSNQSVAKILKENGIDPAPERMKRLRWRDFLRRHQSSVWATDFFNIEIWSKGRLTTFYVLFFLELSSRRVVIAGLTTNPNGQWVEQTARELTGAGSPLANEPIGQSRRRMFLIRDRDSKFTEKFDRIFKFSNFRVLKLPPKSPNLNAHAERFVRTIKSECLDHLILFSEKSLRHTIDEFVQHYHDERPHQGLENALVSGSSTVSLDNTGDEVKLEKTTRLGGLLNSYNRAA